MSFGNEKDMKAQMEQVRQIQQLQFVGELMQNLGDACFKKCVTRPKRSLDSSERSCIENCVDSFTQAMTLVAPVVAKNVEANIAALSQSEGLY